MTDTVLNPEASVSDQIMNGKISDTWLDLDDAKKTIDTINQREELKYGERAHGYFHYEFNPIYHLAKHLDPNSQIKHVGTSTSSYDGEIRHQNGTIQKFECVRAITNDEGYQDTLKSEYLSLPENPIVKAHGKIKADGTKHNRSFGDNSLPCSYAIDKTGLFEHYSDGLREGLTKKVKCKYADQGLHLIVTFDSTFFPWDNDVKKWMDETIEEILNDFRPKIFQIFEKVYFLGHGKPTEIIVFSYDE